LSFYGKITPLMLAAAMLVSTAPARGEQMSEAWFEASLAGAPVGYTFEVVEHTVDGHIVTSVESDFTMRDGNDLVAVRGMDLWTETTDGKPLKYEQRREHPTSATELTLTVEEGRLRIRSSDGREAVFSSIEFDGVMLFPRAIQLLHVSRGFVAGSRYSYSTFDPEVMDVSIFNVTVEGDERLEILGESRDLHKLVVTPELRDGIEIHEWRDDEGALWKRDVPSVGASRRRATSDIVSEEKLAGATLASSIIKTNASISSAFDVDDALYELWIDGEDVSDYIIEDGRQSIQGTTDRGVLLRVSRVMPQPGTTMKFPVRSTPLKDYLDGNPLLQSWYPILMAAGAKSVWETERDTWLGAQKIETWAFENIGGKELGTSFSSSMVVLERLYGDCSDHAVILATVLRAVAIPSRLVSGLIHFDGRFAYHVWVEAWTGEDWFALDSTVGDGSVDATHIKLAESAAPGGNVSELTVGILDIFEKLNIRVVEYTVDGQKVRP
jgi:hypothetical protein